MSDMKRGDLPEPIDPFLAIDNLDSSCIDDDMHNTRILGIKELRASITAALAAAREEGAREAIERCATVCDDVAQNHAYEDCRGADSRTCADQIRALLAKEPPR